mmetsp:Transcript_29603/g.53022  ORF Transcript_29603/g.53022 Transcript_29603/m.53022 type:complete len:580 (-) Transcript_29603:47-1786(-)
MPRAGVLLGAEAGPRGVKKNLRVPSPEPHDMSLNKYCLEVPYEMLKLATNNFDKKEQLGSGGFGVVYRGTQPDGTECAVKALDIPKESGFEEEVRVLSKFRHPNLVILMGFARHNSKRFLVYELLEGGDVYRRLQLSGSKVKDFSWRERACAAYDSACGLSHLHHQNPKVFHRDIKTPNILLTRSGTAKMADFGLACLSEHKSHKVGHFAGTVGYVCPHYVSTNVVDERSEVYSFGIVLLELLTACPAAWTANSSEDYHFLVNSVDGDLVRLQGLLDKNARWPQDVAREIGDLALRCTTYPNHELRPDFTEVVRTLRPLRDAPDAPTDRCQQLPQQQPPQQQQPQQQPPQQPPQQRQQPAAASIAGVQAVQYQPARPGVTLFSLTVEWVQNRDILKELPLEDRVLEYKSFPEPGHNRIFLPPMVFGRAEFEPWLRKLLPEGFLSCISRKHFEITADISSQALSDDPEKYPSPYGTRMPCQFKIQNLSRNVLGVGSQASRCVESQQKTSLREDDLISFCVCEQEGVSPWEPFIIFRFMLCNPGNASEVAYLRDAGPEPETGPGSLDLTLPPDVFFESRHR